MAVKWLKNRGSIVLSELKTCTEYGEIPYAIGFANGKTILIEVKTSLSDFRSDKKKKFRNIGGMGGWRFYLAEPDIIPHNEIPDGWGLYEFYNNKVWHKAGHKYNNCSCPPMESDLRSEVAMLKSVIFRIGSKGLDGIVGNFSTYETKNTASISIEI